MLGMVASGDLEAMVSRTAAHGEATCWELLVVSTSRVNTTRCASSCTRVVKSPATTGGWLRLDMSGAQLVAVSSPAP